MDTIQALFDTCQEHNFALTPGEYKGPLVINRPCYIDGNLSTLWAANGPVLQVLSPNVHIKNLRVEVTENKNDHSSFIAIQSDDANTVLENVEVNGEIVGLKDEADHWNLPNIFTLGSFASHEENTFQLKVNAPAPATLENNVKGVSLFPSTLQPGENVITLVTERLRDNTMIYGDIVIRTKVTRRIYVVGKVLDSAPKHVETVLENQIGDAQNNGTIPVPQDVIAPIVSQPILRCPQKGERMFAKELKSNHIKFVLEHIDSTSPLDIDAYCFTLRDNGKAYSDDDFIFFGNPESSDHSLRVTSSKNQAIASLDISRINPDIAKIVISYSIYDDGSDKTFSMAKHTQLRIFSNEKEVLRFPLDTLDQEKTVVAVELYRYKGEWKINFVGAGYAHGLKQLCEEFGIDVQ